MAQSSRVLIRGGNVPGISMEVVVPTSHTFCREAAQKMYPFEGAEYLWVGSWETGDAPENKQTPSPSGIGGNAIGLALLLLPFMLIGSIFGGGSETPPAAPDSAPANVAPTALTVPLSGAPSASQRVMPWDTEEDLTGDPNYTFEKATDEIPTILPLFPPELMPWEIDEDLTGDPNYTFFDYCDS